MGEGEGCSEEVGVEHVPLAMGRFSPTKLHGDCEEIANLSTAYGRRRRNWIDAHGRVPPSQVVDASCGNACTDEGVPQRDAVFIEQPGDRKIAARVRRLRVGRHFEVPGVGTDEESAESRQNRASSINPTVAARAPQMACATTTFRLKDSYAKVTKTARVEHGIEPATREVIAPSQSRTIQPTPVSNASRFVPGVTRDKA